MARETADGSPHGALTVDELRAGLNEVADPTKVDAMQAYMKGRFRFLGITSPDRKAVAKPLVRAARTMAPNELLSFADELYEQDEREFHYVAIEMMRAGSRNLGPEQLDWVRSFIETHSWWDTIDGLASNTVGPMVANHPKLALAMDAWVEDDNIWVARTATLHQLKYKENTDLDRLFGYALKRAADTEFFIRKAIGWSLRQYAWVDPDAIRAFLDKHGAAFSGLTVREASKHL